MGKVIEFKNPGECCGNCHYYVPPRQGSPTLKGPPSAYCTHPKRVQGHCLYEDAIQALNLFRSPNQWCTRYQRRNYVVPETSRFNNE